MTTLKGFFDGIKLGLKLRKEILHNCNAIEPRIKAGLLDVLREIAFLIRLYLRYGSKASKLYYLAITRSLGERVLAGQELSCSLSALLKDARRISSIRI